SHPKDLTDKLINAITDLDKVCEHLHLPIQSGSDKILKLMNRKYTTSDYFKIIEKLKNKIPEMSFTTDILVGFPGETKEDFKLTIDAIKKVSFDALFAFKYSPRPGTSASKLEDNIAREIKEKRLKEVLDAANSVSDKKNAKLLNKTFDVLVEEKLGDFLEGRSRANRKIFFKGNEDLIGKTLPVKIVEVKINTLTGEIAF
ncbi:MAG: radical SAM protein, partial [Elusimicrobia bacterium]|nr:radical SAM protein [Elusimicrobiota bacterium]